MDFKVFKAEVAHQFEQMKKYPLFRVQVEKDKLWSTYLESFPKGSNPIFRERTEHDCSCCKHFIRAVGDVVALVEGKLESIWDINLKEELGYQEVADALATLVKTQPVVDVFLHFERNAGIDKNFEQLVEGGQLAYEHFFINIPLAYVKPGKDIASALSGPRSTHDVMLRSLLEITDDSIDTVLDLIAQRSLYRGDEHKFVVEEFRKLKQQFNKLKQNEQDLFIWAKIDIAESVSHIRNTVIGTLLVDLSEGKDLEPSVASFEAKVAPTNYKRPTSLITKAMIEQAKAKLEELGLTSALERRYANLRDITVNNILFADRDAKKVMTGNIFDDLSATVSSKTKNLDKVEEVPIDRFLKEILPKATSIEVMLENRHSTNLVSLIAPVDPTCGHLFKWNNNFSWSYNGELADSIKERVKAAGGDVEGDVCCRLAWNNTDDLDFHMIEPNGYRILYTCRRTRSPCGGVLDLDANGADGMRTDPAENIFYARKHDMHLGTYQLIVHQFNKRNHDADTAGFEVEIDVQGTVYHFVYNKQVRQSEYIQVADIVVDKNGDIKVEAKLQSTQAVRTIWGLASQTFHRVSVMMQSPNHWDDRAIGNKHYFFMLEGCKNDDSARGFFNEFLAEELNKHRKVFEIIGSKMKIQDSKDQLSGLGFSSTKPDTLLCRVKGAFTRTIKIDF
jgi:hypothetical protein